MQHEWERGGMHIGYWWEIQKEPLGLPRRRRVDNIKMDLREIHKETIFKVKEEF
jgi:hypothetical protein